jgi:hypothetical protein
MGDRANLKSGPPIPHDAKEPRAETRKDKITTENTEGTEDFLRAFARNHFFSVPSVLSVVNFFFAPPGTSP